jgi:hypothetical protein
MHTHLSVGSPASNHSSSGLHASHQRHTRPQPVQHMCCSIGVGYHAGPGVQGKRQTQQQQWQQHGTRHWRRCAVASPACLARLPSSVAAGLAYLNGMSKNQPVCCHHRVSPVWTLWSGLPQYLDLHADVHCTSLVIVSGWHRPKPCSLSGSTQHAKSTNSTCGPPACSAVPPNHQATKGRQAGMLSCKCVSRASLGCACNRLQMSVTVSVLLLRWTSPIACAYGRQYRFEPACFGTNHSEGNSTMRIWTYSSAC